MKRILLNHREIIKVGISKDKAFYAIKNYLTLIIILINLFCLPKNVNHKESNKNLTFFLLYSNHSKVLIDEFEPNNSFEQAVCFDKLKSDSNLANSLSVYGKDEFDEDYYFVKLDKDKIFKLYFNTFVSSIGKLTFKIYDQNKTLLNVSLKKSNFISLNQDEFLETEFIPTYTGKYYLHIFFNVKELSTSTTNYTIRLLPVINFTTFILSYSNPCE